MSAFLKILQSLFKPGKKQRRSASNKKASTGSARTRPSSAIQKLNKHMEFLETRWAEADRLHDAGEMDGFGEWYYQEPTEAQLDKLHSLDLHQVIPQSRGSASDIIGLFSVPTHEQKEFLQFFKTYQPGMTETHAREAIRWIRLDPNNKQAWEERPPDFTQKVFFSLIGRKISEAKTAAAATELITNICAESDDDDIRWTAICEFWEELQDPDTRADYALKSVPKKVFQECVVEYLGDLDTLDDYDLSDFIDALLMHYPDLEKEL